MRQKKPNSVLDARHHSTQDWRADGLFPLPLRRKVFLIGASHNSNRKFERPSQGSLDWVLECTLISRWKREICNQSASPFHHVSFWPIHPFTNSPIRLPHLTRRLFLSLQLMELETLIGLMNYCRNRPKALLISATSKTSMADIRAYLR